MTWKDAALSQVTEHNLTLLNYESCARMLHDACHEALKRNGIEDYQLTPASEEKAHIVELTLLGMLYYGTARDRGGMPEQSVRKTPEMTAADEFQRIYALLLEYRNEHFIPGYREALRVNIEYRYLNIIDPRQAEINSERNMREQFQKLHNLGLEEDYPAYRADTIRVWASQHVMELRNQPGYLQEINDCETATYSNMLSEEDAKEIYLLAAAIRQNYKDAGIDLPAMAKQYDLSLRSPNSLRTSFYLEKLLNVDDRLLQLSEQQRQVLAL